MHHTQYFFNPAKLSSAQKPIKNKIKSLPFLQHTPNEYVYTRKMVYFRKKKKDTLTAADKKDIQALDGTSTYVFKKYHGFMVIDTKIFRNKLIWLLVSDVREK